MSIVFFFYLDIAPDGQMTSSSTAKFWFRMNTAPNIFVGAQMPNHQPRWQAAPDFTKGNVESCAVHELELSIDATGFHSLIKNISEYSPGSVSLSDCCILLCKSHAHHLNVLMLFRFRKMLSEKLDRKMLSRNGTGRSFPSATKPHPGSKSSSEPGTDGDALTAAERNKARKRKRTITSSGTFHYCQSRLVVFNWIPCFFFVLYSLRILYRCRSAV